MEGREAIAVCAGGGAGAGLRQTLHQGRRRRLRRHVKGVAPAAVGHARRGASGQQQLGALWGLRMPL